MTTKTFEVFDLRESNKKEPKAIPVKSPQEYLRINFPKKENEAEVRYCQVGPHQYRINFYCNDKSESGMSNFRNLFICRSLYVIVKCENGKWSHKIWDD